MAMARAGARGRRHLLLAALLLCVACTSAPGVAAAALRASAISAAPSPSPSSHPLPRPRHGVHPSVPPALSPDIMPLLPSPGPGDAALAPSDAAATIPSSPSPPNPDALEPDSAFAPFSSAAPATVAAQSSASRPAPPRAAWAALSAVVLVAAMWLAQ
ncbi:unnamed protein product [Alopecurus aequalis]